MKIYTMPLIDPTDNVVEQIILCPSRNWRVDKRRPQKTRQDTAANRAKKKTTNRTARHTVWELPIIDTVDMRKHIDKCFCYTTDGEKPFSWYFDLEGEIIHAEIGVKTAAGNRWDDFYISLADASEKGLIID